MSLTANEAPLKPNITVSALEEVYGAARIRAAERGTSVGRLAAEHLGSLPEREAESERLNEQRRRIVAGVEHRSAADRLSRDETHERRVR